MKNPFHSGDILEYKKIVQTVDIAAFESGTVHHVYATFSIARDAEWSGRLFVLQMKEEGEEGIGTYIQVYHRSPALVHEEVLFRSTFEEITEKGEIITSFQAFVGNRLIAEGKQGQRILPKEKLEGLFKKLSESGKA